MIIQGTTGACKSYLIHCIQHALWVLASKDNSPLLTVAPTRVSTFNIHASTIHATLRIPIREMYPLRGQSLLVFQEEMRHVQYLLIDEFSFIGPKLLLKIDSRLCEASPINKKCALVVLL